MEYFQEEAKKRLQTVKRKDFKLPEAVYRQALWAARDLPRMKEKLTELEESVERIGIADPSEAVRSGSIIRDTTGRKATELAQLTLRIQAIEKGFLTVPPKYRSGLRDHLSFGIPYPEDYHRNTWKKWQQVALYAVACNLKIL